MQIRAFDLRNKKVIKQESHSQSVRPESLWFWFQKNL